MSDRSRKSTQRLLSKHYKHVGISLIDSVSDLEQLVLLKPDLVFLGMKYIPTNSEADPKGPNKIWISEYLDMHEIEYTGSGKFGHINELNKDKAKALMIDSGISTSPFILAKQGKPLTWINNKLKFPVFIKPSNRGGGLGVDEYSIAYDQESINEKVSSVSKTHDSDSMIEEYLPGQEFSVAVLRKQGSDEYMVMPIELVAEQDENGDSLITGSLKSSNSEVVLSVTDNEIEFKISTLALEAFKILSARDYGRIDIRLDHNGTPQFLEANLLPSLIEDYGSFPKSCKLNANIDYETMIMKIVNLALSRNSSNYDPSLEVNYPAFREIFSV